MMLRIQLYHNKNDILKYFKIEIISHSMPVFTVLLKCSLCKLKETPFNSIFNFFK